MFEAFTPSHRAEKKTKPRSIRLFVEELEGRCLLSIPGFVVGPDGNFWFREGAGQIGQLNPSTGIIKDFSVGSASDISNGGITTGPDGKLWLGYFDRIDSLDPSNGAVQEFALPIGDVTGMGVNIAAGADGNLWFPIHKGPDWWLGRLDPLTGQTKEYAFPEGSNYNFDITAGPDGKVWFTEWTVGAKGAIGRFDPQTGAIQEFQTTGARGPGGITVGPDGNLWFTDDNAYGSTNADRIGRINATTGQIQEFDLPTGHRADPLMTFGSDGNIWYLGYSGSEGTEIGDFNPSTGSVKTSPFPGPWEPIGITRGPDGNLWFLVAAMPGGIHQFAISQFNPITGTFLQLFQPGAKSVAPPSGKPAAANGSISATGSHVSATAGINFLTAVATFTPQVPIASPGSAFQATVEWGDGTTSSIVLTVTDNGTYDVTAGHAYQTAGTYSIKVTIGNYNPANPLGDNPVTIFSTANVDPFNFNMF